MKKPAPKAVDVAKLKLPLGPVERKPGSLLIDKKRKGPK